MKKEDVDWLNADDPVLNLGENNFEEYSERTRT